MTVSPGTRRSWSEGAAHVDTDVIEAVGGHGAADVDVGRGARPRSARLPAVPGVDVDLLDAEAADRQQLGVGAEHLPHVRVVGVWDRCRGELSGSRHACLSVGPPVEEKPGA